MKKFFTIFLIIITILSISACSTNEIETSDNNTTTETTEKQEVQEEAKDKVDEEVKEENTQEGVRDETLKGRGNSDVGRSEPQYKGIIGYVAAYEGYTIDNVSIEGWKWTVPTYQQDKQFWNEVGTIDHKTEVLVKEQMIQHRSHGWYEGYLLVERTDTKEQVYINVNDFITKPYWLSEDKLDAVKYGDYIAKFTQVSDYYAVNKSNDKAELEDGTYILIDGMTGTYGKNGPNNETNQVEGIVLSGSKKGSRIFFNTNDLTIIY